MYSTPLALLACFCAVSLLSNCGRLNRIEAAKDFADVALDASQTRGRVLGDPIRGIDPLPGTRFDAVPVTGQARFQGAAYVAAGAENNRLDGFALVGRSDVIVDFGAAQNNLTGTMSGFQTLDIDDGLVDVGGRLTLRDGEIGGERPNALTVGYSGTLTIADEAYALSGEMSGRLRGTRTSPAAGQSPVRA